MVDALLDHAGLKPNEIAFFTQRDGYGDAGFAGGVAALRRRGPPDGASVGHGRYERNTRSVESGLADLLQLERPPRAVIMVGAYAPARRSSGSHANKSSTRSSSTSHSWEPTRSPTRSAPRGGGDRDPGRSPL